jgi:amino acid permease
MSSFEFLEKLVSYITSEIVIIICLVLIIFINSLNVSDGTGPVGNGFVISFAALSLALVLSNSNSNTVKQL